MDVSLVANLLDAPVLFFFFGLFAVLVGSNLEIPPVIAKFFSLYLLMAIGFKGGVSLNQSGITQTMLLALAAAAIMSMVVPAYAFLILRQRTSAFDAAAIAATYGSVSAVTFIAATSFLASQEIAFGGYMTVALVIMESPAIIMAVFLSALVRSHQAKAGAGPAARSLGAAATGEGPVADTTQVALGRVLKEAFTDGAHLLLLGAMVIGAITGQAGLTKLQPFTQGIFAGILAFFLLDMGIIVARRLKEARNLSPFLVGFALGLPLVNAALATLLAGLLALPVGDAVLLATLSASASYIVVPAVVRYAIPEANPGLYFTLSLAVTFPFNITIGIPLYTNVIQALWGAS
jgi:hypothetical protein